MKKVLIVLMILIVGFIVFVNSRPSEFKVSRSLTMAASSMKVFEQVNDFHNWNAWSPWAKLDPNAKNIFEGPTSGVGAIFRWSGNNQIGEGSNTIVESKPHELIKIKLEILKPYPSTNMVEFTFQPQGEQTLVTWSMGGENNFMGKLMDVVMNFEAMIGQQFDTGLSQLKGVVEGK